jgi:conjugal transfer pilus assembly protein TraE
MHLKQFLNRHAAALGENRLLKFFIIVLGIAWIINSLMIYPSLRYFRVVLVPPNLDRQVSTTGKTSDEGYLRVQGRYIASLIWAFSPDTVQKNYEDTLAMYAPEAYPKAKKAFYAVVEDVVANQLSSDFRIRDVAIDQAKNLITVSGMRRQYIEERQGETSEKTLCVTYQFANGLFQVLDIYEKKES